MFLFEGDVIPSACNVLFIAAATPEDTPLHHALARFALAGRDSMRTVGEDEIGQLLSELSLPEDHPLASFILSDELREAAAGSTAATERLLRRARAPVISIDALRRAREQAEEIGRLGEELVAAFLERNLQGGSITAFEWTSDINAVAPMDFTISGLGAPVERIDVKTTTGPFGRTIHVSGSELKEMARQSAGAYRIYRVYEATEEQAKLRISADLGGFARIIIAVMAGLPSGTIADGISIDPLGIEFGEEIAIAPLDEGTDG